MLSYSLVSVIYLLDIHSRHNFNVSWNTFLSSLESYNKSCNFKDCMLSYRLVSVIILSFWYGFTTQFLMFTLEFALKHFSFKFRIWFLQFYFFNVKLIHISWKNNFANLFYIFPSELKIVNEIWRINWRKINEKLQLFDVANLF